MRVLTAINIGYPQVGGTQITHRTNLELLARRFGHECIYLDQAHTWQRPRSGPVRCDYYRDLSELRHKIEAARPDILIGAFTLIHEAIKIGHRLGIPVVGWCNSYEYCPPSPEEVQAWLLTQTHRYPEPPVRAFALAEADALVANSRYLEQRLARQEGREATVIYPAFDLKTLSVPARRRRPDHIVGVCGYPHKGAGIFLDLARRFPEVRFLLVGAVHADYFPLFRQLSNVEFLSFSPTRQFLATAKLVLVPSQWPEPFGRIAVEAMANGIPTLVSRAAGLAEIVGDTSLGVDDYRSVDAWCDALGHVLSSDASAAENASTGREIAARYTGAGSVLGLEDLVRTLVGNHGAKPKPSQRVVALAGDTETKTAFAMINRRLLEGLRAAGHYSTYPLTEMSAFVPEPVDVTIHHDYGQRFEELEPPAEGHFVAMRTWDFGRYPPAWVKRIREDCDQLWVLSRWTRRQAIASSIPPSRVRVIPPGIDPETFCPEGPRLELATDRRFRFLFVGGPVLRKGIDILLEAYRLAFQAEDDVCLVVKDNPRDLFYTGQRWDEALRALVTDPTAPQLLYLSQLLSAAELAALYRACQVGVFPYRAEGFGMPILEAMACGTPSIVPRFGACLDYCSPRTSFLVAPKRISLPVLGEFAYNSLGFQTTVDEVDFCELRVQDLASAMRQVYCQWQTEPDQLERRAKAGVRQAHGRFTWQHMMAHVDSALTALEATRTPVRLARQRREREHQRRVFETARALFLDLPTSSDLPVRRRSGTALSPPGL